MSTLSPIEQTEKTGKIVTLLISLFFGLFGLIPAFVYKGQLEQAGRPAAPIWKSFWIGFGIYMGIVILISILNIATFAALMAASQR